MNAYQFTLQYDNKGDARDGSKTFAAYLAENGAPKAAATVRYNGATVQFVIEGNVSAVSLVRQLELMEAVYSVVPVGDSKPLPMLVLV